MKKTKPMRYLNLPYHSACGCSLEVIDGGLRTLFTRCPLHANAGELAKIAVAYRNHLKTCAHTDGEVATFHHIEEVLKQAGVK